MERRYEVQSYGVRYICDTCGRGEMVALNGTQAYVQEGGQIKIRHVCTVCHTLATFADKYPTVRHEDIPVQSGASVPGYTQPQQQFQQQQPMQQVVQPQSMQQFQPNMQQPLQQPVQPPIQQIGQPVMPQQIPSITPKS